ncbi:MAG: hypothetical protein M1358_13500 [Chloroflexi bacterium]|nr:hypothetical protein [Chloroflexota bacterium]
MSINTPRLVCELLNQQKPWCVTSAEKDPVSIKVRHKFDCFLQPLVEVSKERPVTTDAKTRKDLAGLTIEQALSLAREKGNG